MSKRALFLLIFSFFVSIAGSLLISGYLYSQTKARILAQQNLDAENLVYRLESVIKDNIWAVQTSTLSEYNKNNFNIGVYEELAKLIIDRFPSVLAVNFVNSEGLIQRVYPLKPNEKALGKNLFDHPEVKTFILEAKRTGQTQLVDPLELYQGGVGITGYIPIGNRFVNVVFRMSDLLNGAMIDGFKENLSIKIFDTDSSKVILDTKNFNGFQKTVREIKLFNQSWTLEASKLGMSGAILQFFKFILPAILILSLSLIFALLYRLIAKNQLIREKEVLIDQKSNLINMVCHDLANPLTIIDYNLGQLNEASPSDQFAKRKSRISSSLRFMGKVVDNINKLNETDGNDFNVEMNEVSLLGLIDRVIVNNEEDIKAKNIKVSIESEIADPVVNFNQGLLKVNVLQNLMRNAIKFSPEGETITIEIVNRKKKIHLLIKNKGEDMSSEQIERFNRGEKLKSSLGTKKEKGTGFGLLIVKSIVSNLGGQVSIQSQNGQFQVEIVFPS